MVIEALFYKNLTGNTKPVRFFLIFAGISRRMKRILLFLLPLILTMSLI